MARDRDRTSDEDDAGLGDEGTVSERSDLAREERGTRSSAEPAAAEPAAAEPAAGTPRSSISTATRITQVVVLLLAGLFAVFAAVNSQPVEFSWVFGETQVERDAGGDVTSGGVPLIVLLVVSFILGATLGGAWVGQVVRSRRRDRAPSGEG
jgi:uncharacterized integral membrane protein